MSLEEELDVAGTAAVETREAYWSVVEKVDMPEGGLDDSELMKLPAVRQAYAAMDAAQSVFQRLHKQWMQQQYGRT